MAQTVYCNGHPDVAAVMLIQELGTPDVMTLCAACVIAWAGAVVASTEQPPPEPVTPDELDPAEGLPVSEFMSAGFSPELSGGQDGSLAGPPEYEDDTTTGGDEHDGDLRARSGGVDGADRPALGEAGPVDGGAGGGTDRPGRRGRKPAEARTGD